MNKILDANDKAIEEGYPDAQKRLEDMIRKYKLTYKNTGGQPTINAFMNYGRWLASCECGNGAEYVAKDIPFMCFECGNAQTNGILREVIFPKNRKSIETEILKREVIPGVGLVDSVRVRRSKPVKPFVSRSWMPGESVADLKKQRKDKLPTFEKGK